MVASISSRIQALKSRTLRLSLLVAEVTSQ